jgi:hypothetical protein
MELVLDELVLLYDLDTVELLEMEVIALDLELDTVELDEDFEFVDVLEAVLDLELAGEDEAVEWDVVIVVNVAGLVEVDDDLLAELVADVLLLLVDGAAEDPTLEQLAEGWAGRVPV